MRRGWVAAGLVVSVVCAGCSSSNQPVDNPVISTTTTTTTRTSTQPATPYHPKPDRAVAPLPYGAKAPKGEVDKRCPYIKTGLNQDSSYVPGTNVADIEGDRIYRTTVLTRLPPVGCRLYFYAPPYEAVADILPRTFKTALDAHNALVLTARLGTEPISKPSFVAGVDGILYRTTFFAQDGHRDWAFAFAKGKVLVVVHTQRTDTSLNAFDLGKAIVGKF